MNLKLNKKESIHFTIDKKVNNELNEYINKNCINRSFLLQKLIIDFLKKQEVSTSCFLENQIK